MLIRLYTFTKKHNSTARPADSSPYHELDVYLKRNTSINAPTFLLDFEGVIPDYNYLVIPSMRMYYYIDDYVLGNNNILEIVCKIDSLATARPYIKAGSAFVKYSSSNFNVYLKDDRIQPTAELTSLVSNNSFASDINTNPEYTSSYSFLLTVLNGDPDGNEAGIKHYLINATVLRYLCKRLVADGDSIIGGTKMIFADAKDSIINLQLVPWSLSGLQRADIIGNNPTEIYLGDYDTGQTGYVMDANATYEVNDFLSLPALPDDFTKIEPFCEGKMHIPLIGTFDFSLSEVADVNRIYFRYICNIASGAATCIVYKGNADINNTNVKIIGSYNGSVNADVPLGYAVSSNPTGGLTGALSLAAAAFGSGAITVGGIAGAIASFASYFTKTASVINSFGGNTSAKDNVKLSIYVMKRGLSEQPDNLRILYGRPCAKVLPLAELTGYCQTSQFELMAPLDDSIVQEVNRLMDTGVYLE